MREDSIAVDLIRKHIKKNIHNRISFNEYIKERTELLNILKRTITGGESDSVLLVGPRGCGKSEVVKRCLADIKNNFDNDDYILVNLNGLVHTDDSLAFRAIIEQLHLNELEGDQITGSFSDNIMFVLQSFHCAERDKAKPILFILDEFQLFCAHRNQTLLYNLFDISKSVQAPICVVGMTCRFDITELLEKRVSSRFSHRQILLMPSVNIDDRVLQFSSYMKIGKRTPSLRKVNVNTIEEWNNNIDYLLTLPNVLQRIRRQFEIDSSRRAFKNTLFCLISKITSSNPLITLKNIQDAFQKYYTDEKVEYLKDLSVLELCLVLSMCNHVEIYEGEPFNFEMIIDRYLKFPQLNSCIQITQRPILLKAFERIKELELIQPITYSSRNQKKEYCLYNLMVTKHQVKEAVKGYIGLPTDVYQWSFTNV